MQPWSTMSLHIYSSCGKIWPTHFVESVVLPGPISDWHDRRRHTSLWVLNLESYNYTRVNTTQHLAGAGLHVPHKCWGGAEHEHSAGKCQLHRHSMDIERDEICRKLVCSRIESLSFPGLTWKRSLACVHTGSRQGDICGKWSRQEGSFL